MTIRKRIALSRDASVYLDPLPKDVNPVSMQLVVFAGSADDRVVNSPGIHHWFEHVPFRGTVRFPEGSKARARFSRVGGRIGAYTSRNHTSYNAYVPKSMWADALEMIVELAAQPLLRREDIEAERLIIKEEIKQRNSQSNTFVYDHLPSILWPGHPLAHSILGSDETLEATDPDILAKAHALSYAAQRCALIVSGDVSEDEFVVKAEELMRRMPERELEARMMPASYGELPAWQEGAYTEVDVPFDSSVVMMLFSRPPKVPTLMRRPIDSALTSAFVAGGMASPLYRIVREERNLVYSTSYQWSTSRDGGYWGFKAQCGANNIGPVLEAFKDVLADPEAQTRERYDFVRDCYWGHQQMRLIDPSDRTGSMLGSLESYGVVMSDEALTARVLDVKHDEVLAAIAELDPARAHTVVYKGRK